MKRTSTSELTVESGFQLALISQPKTMRCGGSHTRIWPTTASLPSACLVYQRPPSLGSLLDCTTGVLPMPCDLGHQRSIPLVNTSNAFACDAFTTSVLFTGAI